MTTDKTPATLATVKHGGCVQLGQDQRSDLVPGVVRCAKCAFQLHRTNLYLQSGTVGAGDSKTEPCPNGCGPLWPVTWETWAREGWAEAERLHLENVALSAQPSPGGQGDRPLRVFSAGVWTYNGTGQSFSHEDMDAAAFVVYRDATLSARQPVYVQGSDELRARTEGERAAYMEGLEEGKKIAARQAVGKIDEAAVLRRAAAVLDMWEGDSNQTGYMGDFKDAQAILEVLAQNAAQSAQAVDLGQSIPSELAPVAAALKRFGDCAEDSGSEGCDIGRDWFDALTTIGLLSRTQRSPAVWTMTEEGERLLALIDKAVQP
ncbi:TPA: hypothetical protein UM365_000539 [Stenotrophomonas maltophilia]|nr:hypothetical protein [Stenotrophomonas maltophilia]